MPVAGQLFRNPDLAATYRTILAEAESGGDSREVQIEAARRAFYEGFVAEAIDAFVSRESVMDASGTPHRGVLRGSDLASWRATIEPTTSFKYRDFEIHKTDAWGQGPVFLQQLALLEAVEVGALGFLSAEYIHLMVEGAKLAFADREAGMATRRTYRSTLYRATVRRRSAVADRPSSFGHLAPRRAGWPLAPDPTFRTRALTDRAPDEHWRTDYRVRAW